jgi:serine protease Do
MEVYAAGYPFGDPEFTMTRGIISKDDATSANSTNWASVDHVIMHDAQINPGNSGGPLVDGKGNVVGVNYMGNSANQFFAIGSDLALQVIDTLRTGKDLDTLGINGRADLIVYSDGSDTEIPLPGLWVSSVESGSPADRIGVRAGDIIYQMENLILVPVSDGDTVATVQQKLTMEKYCSILRSHYPTDQLAVTVIRMVDGWPVFLEGKINGDLLTEQ